MSSTVPSEFTGWAAVGKDCLKGKFEKTNYKPKVGIVSSLLSVTANDDMLSGLGGDRRRYQNRKPIVFGGSFTIS